jgi:hypothetical protein
MDLLRSPTLCIPPALMNGAAGRTQQQQLQKQPFHKPLHRPLEQQQQLVQQGIASSSSSAAAAAAAAIAVQHRGESSLQLNITQTQVRAVVRVSSGCVLCYACTRLHLHTCDVLATPRYAMGRVRTDVMLH